LTSGWKGRLGIKGATKKLTKEKECS